MDFFRIYVEWDKSFLLLFTESGYIMSVNKYRGACGSRLRGSHPTSTLNLMRIMPP